MNKIPLVDVKANYLSLKKEIDKSIQLVIEQTAFIGGRDNLFITKFEDEFGKYLKNSNVISCANGTDAIEIALQALGIGNGDEVIVPAITWISTAEAIINVGATPIFIDINNDTLNINVKLIEQKITLKTKAIIAVHLYGCPSDVNFINKICTKHQLLFIEDCAQAHGAMVGNKKVGTFGDAATFSFYPGKNLGAFGDAGAMVFKNKSVAEKARQIANHGQQKKHQHKCIGRNSRMDGIQASILTTKLAYLDEWNALRIKHAEAYTNLIHSNFKKPIIPFNTKHVFHLYVIKVPPKVRSKIVESLYNKGISTSIHYPNPLHSMPIFNTKEKCVTASKVCKSILSLPIYPELTYEKIEYISKFLNKFK